MKDIPCETPATPLVSLGGSTSSTAGTPLTTFRARPCLTDRDSAPFDFFPVQRFNGCLSLLRVGHLHKPKAF